ncbi:MAG: YitT family protein, partial [Bacteroidales bacterium]|nr:YitT family protein [Bacteroidales bacterium]
MGSWNGGVFKTIREYVMVTIGMLLYVVGYTTFIMPHNIVGGGVTGIATIIQYATGLKAGYSYFVINAILLTAAFKSLGKGFGAKTVYAIIICSIGLNVFQDITANYGPARQIVQMLAIENGKLLSTIMAAIIAGVGMGMAISAGGSSGGTDILALIINKYRDITPGKLILYFDVIIISSSLLFPSHLPSGELMPIADKITTVVYGLIVTTICGNVVDLYLSGNRQSVQVFVFSQHY